MASSVGWAALKVIPTVEGVAKEVSAQVVAPLKAGGEKAGKEMGAAIADGVKRSEATVKSATQAQVKAMAAVEDQSSKVRVAELKLQELRDSGKAKASQIEAAEAKITTERRKLNDVVGQAEAAEKHLADARDAATQAAKDAEKATDKLSGSHDDAAKAAKDEADELEKLEKEAKKAEQASEDLEGMQGKLAIGFAAVAAAVVGVVTGLVAVGGEFDDMYDAIRIGTGASGEAFEELQDSARRVADALPAMDGGLEQIGSTMADVNTRTGATGETLEALTQQFVALSNMGVDADINDITGAFTAYGTEVADMPQALDDLHAIQQATGVSMTSLAQSLEKGGPALREFGFGLNSSAGLVGALDKAGIDADKTIAGMAKGLGQFVKAGEAPEEAMWRTISSIEDLMEAGDKAEAQDLALKLLGPKNFAPFLEAIENGTFAFDDMMDSIGASEDTILGLHEETSDWAESWQMFKQKALLAVEPLATALFDQLAPALETGAEWLEKIVKFVGDNEKLFTGLVVVFGSMTVALGAYTVATKAWEVATKLAKIAQDLLNGSFKASGIGLIITLVAGLVAGIIYLATQTEFFQKLWEVVWGAIKTAFSAVFDFIKKHWSTILMVLTGPIGIAVGLIVKNWDKISAAFQAVWDFVKGITQVFVDWIVAAWDGFISFFTEMPGRIAGVASTMWDSVKNAAGVVKDWVVGKWDEMMGFVTGLPGRIATAASGMWDGIKTAFKEVINWIIRAWNSLEFKIPGAKIPGTNIGFDGFTLGVPKIPELYTGGIIPGYTPGVDTTVIAAGGGEAVMRPEWTRAVGADYVHEANAAARAGGIPGVERFLGAYKDGGIVREPYGLPVGTNTGGFGSGGDAFPPWVHQIAAEHQVKPSTYPGHQEKSGQNKGIDWVGSVGAMHSFAEWLASIGDQLEQVIWMHPQTGQKIGIADGVPVGPGTSQPGYYSSDWGGHQDHVHTRQSYAFGKVQMVEPEQFLVDSDRETLTRDSIERDGSSTPAGPEKVFSAKDRYRSMFTDLGGIAADASMEIFGLGDWLDLADRYTIVDSDAASPSLSPGTAEAAAADEAVASAVPVVPESAEVARYGAELYAYEIARVAKEMGLGEKGALIGEAAAIVEAGNPLRMWANSKLPASLDFPHDAVGSNGTSTGLFQQQDFAEWGTLAQRMDPAESARMFYEHFPTGWESMDPGKVAQGVQRSSLPHRYGQEMGAAQKLLDSTGLFDTGGIWEPGTLGFNGLDEPEMVLRDAHWKTAKANIDKVDELVGAGGSRGTVINQTFNTTVADQRDFQRTVNRDRDLAMMQHGGRP